MLEGKSGTIGVFIKDVISGNVLVEVNSDEVFCAASLIKLRLFTACINRISLKDEKVVDGFGILRLMDLEKLSLSFKELATLMIVLSDNIATNILIDHCGGFEKINEHIEKNLGIHQTLLQRKMMDFKAKRRGLDNFTTPRDISVILERMILSGDLSEQSRNQFLQILMEQKCRNKLPAKMKLDDITVGNKTGDLPGIEHDAAIFIKNEQTKLIAVVMKELVNNQDGIRLHQQIGTIRRFL